MEEYKKVTISFTKDQLEKLDEIMSKEQGYSRSSLVREAVDYYLGYLAQKGSFKICAANHGTQTDYEYIFKLMTDISILRPPWLFNLFYSFF